MKLIPLEPPPDPLPEPPDVEPPLVDPPDVDPPEVEPPVEEPLFVPLPEVDPPLPVFEPLESPVGGLYHPDPPPLFGSTGVEPVFEFCWFGRFPEDAATLA